ncbi:hypothetical protein [Radiobacillus deserti]|uniref:Uncharacterized protein n=1 Tax=Radiobacillus deserti TaxID=2594883 RepID=A0A516KDH3_9BACI|nr:hypothetical protein [Radiobacillus deserti]QDP39462.1 hypothetical protein FN924_04285 [Radiobacillus deserti]
MRVSETNSLFMNKQINNQTKQLSNPKKNNQTFHDYLEKTNIDLASLNKLQDAYTNKVDFIRAKGQNTDAPFLTLDDLINTLSDEKNALTLTPGTKIKLAAYRNPEVYVTVKEDSVHISTDKTALGSAYVDAFNSTVRKMLYVTDSNEIPDLSKLSKEDLAIVKQMQNEHTDAVKGIGGDEEYQFLHTIAESLGNFIRFANGQSPWVAVQNHEEIKKGLEMMGIDTSQAFYVNGSSLYVGEDGLVRKS